MNFEKTATLLKAMANIKRLEILIYLRHSELSVGTLQQKLKLSQSALSQHLAVLRAAEIVQTRRNKQQIFYRLQSERTRQMLNILFKDSK